MNFKQEVLRMLGEDYIEENYFGRKEYAKHFAPPKEPKKVMPEHRYEISRETIFDIIKNKLTRKDFEVMKNISPGKNAEKIFQSKMIAKYAEKIYSIIARNGIRITWLSGYGPEYNNNLVYPADRESFLRSLKLPTNYTNWHDQYYMEGKGTK